MGYIFETTIARRFANRRRPILPDERRADGRRELRRAIILKGKNSKEKNVVGKPKVNTNEDQTWNFKQENAVA